MTAQRSAPPAVAAAVTPVVDAMTPSTPIRRGRPPGARSKVLADGRAIGAHHIAFLRALLQGLELRAAWRRYMAFVVDAHDLRVMESTHAAVLRAVLAAGHAAERSRPGLRLRPALDLLGRSSGFVAPTAAAAPSPAPSAAREPPQAALPSLDEWMDAQGIDPDFSQAELLELYREHFGLGDEDLAPSAPSAASAPTPRSALSHAEPASAAPEKPDVSAQLRALNEVAAVVTQPPAPTDAVGRWLAPSLAAALQRAGVATLADLVTLVNLHGFRWYAQVDGLGVQRARAVLEWLQGLTEELSGFSGHLLRSSSLSPPQQQAAWTRAMARDVALPPAFALVPLERLHVPPALRGRDGLFRSPHPNTLGAEDDLQALQRWLGRYERTHTQRAYRKEAERFYLWALIVARKPLSSIDSHDCQAYRRFIAAPPADWVQGRRSGRHGPGWRPFAGPLSASSQKQALVVVQVMFEGLQKSGYLVANPMAQVMKGFDLPAGRIRTERSMGRAEWAYLTAAARAQAPGPEQRRVMLLLELLVSTGIRLEELTQARLSDLSQVPVDGEDEPAWVLQVTGKRRKTRTVPVDAALVQLIHAHHDDQVALGIVMPACPALVGSLQAPPPQWQAQGTGVALVRPPVRQALSASGIYRCLKRFFVRAGMAAGGSGVDGERLLQASTHWLRHTFGRQAVEAAVPTYIVQSALGHESLATTGIYVTAERSSMIKALRRLRPGAAG
jgi:site-specific recombinase XerD